jgi:hypothetical protein
MATENQTSSPDTSSALTAETIADGALKANLGPIDERTILMINYCNARAEKKLYENIHPLKLKIVEFEEKYKSILREMRDTIQSVRFGDFLKVFLGILGGFIVSSASQKTSDDFFSNGWCLGAILLFIIVLIFLIGQNVKPTNRRKEIIEELNRMNKEDE